MFKFITDLFTNKEKLELSREEERSFTKNIDEKMYTATRYYFKKKESKETKEDLICKNLENDQTADNRNGLTVKFFKNGNKTTQK